MKRDDPYRLSRIVEIGHQLSEVMAQERITRADILDSLKVQWLITTPLYNIGEQAHCVSQEFKEAHPELPWSGVSGMRHRLVHDYEGTNWSLISTIVFDELPEFVDGVERILNNME